jgi:small-conductance mechanosensitive channel
MKARDIKRMVQQENEIDTSPLEKIRMNTDKKHHRFVTVISLLLALAIFFAMRFGVLGDTLARFATTYIIVMLLILGVRAVLTELGVRRKREAFERTLEK